MNIAIIVAGGSGTRMNLGYNKVFVELCGQPILCHTLENFEECQEIDSIVITITEQDIGTAQKLVKNAGFKKIEKIVAGGPMRMQSVENGLKAADPKEDDLVLIQDGCRPFTPSSLLEKLMEAAKKHGAAICGAMPKDTIQKLDEEGFAIDTFDRSKLTAVFTPVAARWKLLKQAREKAVKEGYLDTPGFEDAALLQQAGIRVKVIPCGYDNIKITTPQDLVLAETILKCYDKNHA